MQTTHLYIVRHGETEENVAQVLQGRLPGHLTPLGRQQAEELRDRIVAENLRIDAFLVSDLRRTLDTAEILSPAVGRPIQPCPLLRERDWGSLTGRPIAEVNPEQIPDDVETVEAMFSRARAFLIYVVQNFPAQRVLAVTHGLFGRCVQAALLGCTIRDIPRMQNAELRHLTVGPLAFDGEGGGEVISAD